MSPSVASPAAALAIEGLQFRYGATQGPLVIDIPSLTLAPEEQVLLTGPSGSGKSTLLYLIAGLIDPNRGRVLIAGEDVFARRGHARDRLRGRRIGMVFQTFNLLPGFSAAENIMAALMFSSVPRPDHRVRALELLDQLGVTAPDQPVDTLSVGQQQRVAVARAVAAKPDLVLADEPTASLDPDNARAAIDLIQEACRASGAALLCVSHDPSLADKFERRAALHDLCKAGAPWR